MVWRIILYVVLLDSYASVKAQSIIEYRLDGTEQRKSLLAFLEEIEKKNNVRFFFLPEWIDSISFQQSYLGKSLKEALDDLFLGTGLSFFAMHPQEVVIVKDPTQAIFRKQALDAAIRKQKKIVPYRFGDLGKSVKGQRVIIRGRVIDVKTREHMPRTNIQVSDTEYATTDETGKYILSLTPGAHVLNFSFINHEDKVIYLLAYADGEINVEMEEVPILLEEVVIRDHDVRDLTNSSVGQTQLSIRDIKRAPAVLG